MYQYVLSQIFKDLIGHAVGDLLVVRLLANMHQVDTVARLGGDEFVILLDNPANSEEIAHVATCIVVAINESMPLRGQSALVRVSIRNAMHSTNSLSAAQLMKSADTEMYAAKKSGKNTY